MTPAEQQRAVNVLIRDTLVKAGWTLIRDNEPGGTLVLEGDGLSLVGGFHAYESQPPLCDKHHKRMVLAGSTPICLACEAEQAEAVAEAEEEAADTMSVTFTPESLAEVAVDDAFSKVLVPALAAGNGQVALGWVAERYEDGSVEWWNDNEWVDSLNDGAAVFTDDEKFDLLDATWVEVYGHEADGCLTTEPCPGVDTCPDCLDVRKSAGENLADDPVPGHADMACSSCGGDVTPDLLCVNECHDEEV